LQILIILSFDHVVGKLGADNFTQALMETLMHERGLTTDLIGKKLMIFGADGVSIYQAIKSGVT